MINQPTIILPNYIIKYNASSNVYSYLISEFQANSNKSILKDALLISDFEDDLLQQENVDEKGKMCSYHW